VQQRVDRRARLRRTRLSGCAPNPAPQNPPMEGPTQKWVTPASFNWSPYPVSAGTRFRRGARPSDGAVTNGCRRVASGTQFRSIAQMARKARKPDDAERALMRRYEAGKAGFAELEDDDEDRLLTELARRGWIWSWRGYQKGKRWRDDLQQHATWRVDQFGGKHASYSGHEIVAMIRHDRDLRNRPFRVFVDDCQLAGSNDAIEIEFAYLKACAVPVFAGVIVRLESDDKAAVAPGRWRIDECSSGIREAGTLRVLQTSWHPSLSQDAASWRGPTPAQVKAILRYIGAKEADIAVKLGVDARSLRHWKEGARAMTLANWQLLRLMAGFRPAWLEYDQVHQLRRT